MMRYSFSAPPVTRATDRWSAWCATRACSRLVAAPRKFCAPWSPRRCSAADSRKPATAISWTARNRRSRGDRSLALEQHPVEISVFGHVVIGGRLVQHASVIPDDHVALAPFVAVDVLALRRVGK